MKIEVVINHREAIPVRAIPFITGWAMSPDNVAASLANRDLSDKLKGVAAYHLIGNGELAKILPKEWDGIEADLQALSDTLKADKRTESKSYRLWRRDSIPLLPSGVFVWKDEFDTAFARAYSPYHRTLLDERDGDRDLNYSPMIPLELRAAVFEGFNMQVETDALASNVARDMQPAVAKVKSAMSITKQPINFDSQTTKWRKAFEYESKGLNAMYDLIESHYFDADGKPIYEPSQWVLKKNLLSEWLTGRTLDEADTIITSGNRKGKAEK